MIISKRKIKMPKNDIQHSNTIIFFSFKVKQIVKRELNLVQMTPYFKYFFDQILY